MSLVKVRRVRSGTGGIVSSVTIPKDIADDLVKAGVEAFDMTLTEDGIVLRPVTSAAPAVDRPAWLRPPAEEPERLPNARRATRADGARTASA